MSRARSDLVGTLADRILLRRRPHFRIAIDGRDAAGKTVLADELAVELTSRRVEVVRASIDGWHNPAEVRYRLGRDSPEGYYRDSFDLDSLRRRLLDPFSRGEPFVTAVYDYRTESALDASEVMAGEQAVLVFDGIFLLRPALRDCWDLTVYVSVPEVVAMERGIARDKTAAGGEQEARRRYLQRYVPGQALYHREARPAELAALVVDNTDLDHPALVCRA